MHKIIIVFLLGLCGLPAFAAPWNALDDNIVVHKKPEKSLSNLVDKTLLPQLLSRQAPLRYCVEGAADTDRYARLLEKGYTSWFGQTAQIIRRAGRADEFADLLPFLEKPLLFQRQACSRNKSVEESFHLWAEPEWLEQNPGASPEQVRLLLLDSDNVSNACGSSTVANNLACAGMPERFGAHIVVMPFLNPDEKTDWWNSFLHELGHTLGVGEGYKMGDTKNSPFFGTGFREGGIMNARTEQEVSFSCDEADAMVIFMDSLSVPGKPSRRGKTARKFQSFCAHDPVWYSDGRQLKRASRAAGDEGRFTYTTYQSDGSARQFTVLPPDPKGFASSLHLFERIPAAAPAKAGGMKYYSSKDGRKFAVQDLEDPGVKRIFTLKDQKLLGTTFLDTNTPNEVRAVTLLDSKDNKTRLVREENIIRGENESGSFFVWNQQEGIVRKGVLGECSARVAYVFPDWMVMSLVEPDVNRATTILLENAPQGGQRMQVYQTDGNGKLGGGSFWVLNGKVKRLGDLTARDERYLENFSALDTMISGLQAASNTFVARLGKSAAPGEISSKDVLAWSWTAGKLHAQMAVAVKTYLAESPFGVARSQAHKEAFREFSLRFRPSPPIHVAKPARGN